MGKKDLKINAQSIRTELKSYEDKPYDCIFEYIWNSFDAGATEVKLHFDVPNEGIGYVQNVVISDNGNGWDFNDDATTNNFMSSTKEPKKNRTLPKGQYGRGRYSFIWIAGELHVYSKSRKMILHHNTEIQTEDIDEEIVGTRVEFLQISEKLSDALLSKELEHALSVEFCWFLAENEQKKIYINDQPLEVDFLIKHIANYDATSLPKNIQKEIDGTFYAKIIIWNEKPSEYSKFYFIDCDKKEELLKLNTGLNKKSDDFWHSVYISSSLFSSEECDFSEDDNTAQQRLEFFGGNKKIKKQIITFLKTELVNIRKPYLKKQSEIIYDNLVEENAIPVLSEFGIFDTGSFEELIKTIYTISPSLFTNKSSSERKFICATFAGLLSSQDNNLVKVVLEQLQELTAEEQKDLLDILNRTRLSNVVSTIKEIDHRLDVLKKLEFLISECEKQTLEVKHIQRILDNNFWIFGEQFRLFSSTEGALRNVLLRYAKEELGIEDPELEGSPTGEMDLFLTKTEYTDEIRQRNIIVELKRASKKLGKKEYDQIESYQERISKESLCNGDNQYWEFYLIGKSYNEHIEGKIDSAKNYGEKSRGLCYSIKDGRYKIYVRKWSDILEVEWGSKMKYLKEKLNILSRTSQQTPDEVTKSITN